MDEDIVYKEFLSEIFKKKKKESKHKGKIHLTHDINDKDLYVT